MKKHTNAISSLLGVENEDEYNDMYVFGRDGYLAARGSESFMYVYNVATKKEKYRLSLQMRVLNTKTIEYLNMVK